MRRWQQQQGLLAWHCSNRRSSRKEGKRGRGGYYGDTPADDTKLLDPAAPTTSKGMATVNFAANYKWNRISKTTETRLCATTGGTSAHIHTPSIHPLTHTQFHAHIDNDNSFEANERRLRCGSNQTNKQWTPLVVLHCGAGGARGRGPKAECVKCGLRALWAWECASARARRRGTWRLAKAKNKVENS